MFRRKSQRTVFESMGGSFQFRARCAEDLKQILALDPTAWAALCVPVSSLNGDPAFFQALDADGNGMIRVDEVKAAISWLSGLLTDIKVLNNGVDTLPVTALDTNNTDGKLLSDFINQHKHEILDDSEVLELGKIRAKLAAVTAGPLAGDGKLRAKAVSDPSDLALYNDITTLLNCKDALTAPQLEKFAADAASFIEWAKTAEKPQFRNDDPVKYYEIFKSLSGKIDEYFRFCELIKVDPAHAARFSLDPAKLPELDLQDSAKIDSLLQNAPLAKPDAAGILNLAEATNPFYQNKVKAFADIFDIQQLDHPQWLELKAEFTPYIDYLAKAQGDLAALLGKEKLENYLNSESINNLRKLFAADQSIGGVVDALKKLERLLLYCRYMLTFVNNFVCFEDFFNEERTSMLQAGRLIMDGRSYTLAVWINDIAAHKKIAVKSNLCLLYLEVTSSGKTPVTRKVAVAVTGGTLSRIYIGKPAFFVDNDNITYNGKIVDMVEGPISFGQTLSSPFRRLSEALGEKMQKLTDFSQTEKQLVNAIDKGTLPTAPAAPANASISQKFLGNGSMMLLAGGLSMAALGAGVSFVLKGITNAIATISALPFYVILFWVFAAVAIILVPASIFAFLKLRKRNLTLFLEAGGWSINLHMRLNMYISGIFTHSTQYPENTEFKLCKVPGKKRSLLFVLLVILVLAIAAAALWYLHSQTAV